MWEMHMVEGFTFSVNGKGTSGIEKLTVMKHLTHMDNLSICVKKILWHRYLVMIHIRTK